MTRDVEITLISPVKEPDEYGIPQVISEEETTVMATVKSITASEFFEAGRNGFKPEFRFDMFLYDYDGQKELEYKGVRYTVYRTFMGKSDTVELYVTLKGGTNG